MNAIFLFASMISFSVPDYRTDDRYPGVCVQDIWEFGTNKEDARYCYHLARRHIEFYNDKIRDNYQFGLYMAWKSEANKSLTAWDYLDNCFIIQSNELDDLIWKLRSLENLKKIIGDEAYNSRRMPPPCPQMFE